MKNKYKIKKCSKGIKKAETGIQDVNTGTGAAIGGAVGSGLSLIPGVGPIVGAIASPALGLAGNLIENQINKPKLERLKKEQNFQDGIAKNNENINTDLTSFQAKQYKSGGKVSTKTNLIPSEEQKFQKYRKSLPKNLQTDNESYDLRGAYKSGIKPEKVEDGTYHMGTRVPSTGQILKSPSHPTYKKGLEEDMKLGYVPQVGADGKMYTKNIMKEPQFSKGTKLIEIEGKKTPEIHTDANFNVKNLGTQPHSKGGNKVLAEEGDVVFPTQNSPKKYNEIMNAIMKKDKYKLKKEQSKLPEDKASKYPDGAAAIRKERWDKLDNWTRRTSGDFKERMGVRGSLLTAGIPLGMMPDLNVKDTSLPHVPASVKSATDKEWKAPMSVPKYSPLKPNTSNALGYLPSGFQAEIKSPTVKSGGKVGKGANKTQAQRVQYNSNKIENNAGVKAPTNATTLEALKIPDTKPWSQDQNVVKPEESTGLKLPKVNANSLMELAPIAYNLGQGLFGKTEKVNRRNYNPELEKYVDTSSNMRREVNGAYKVAQSNARNLSGGNVANIRANSQAASNAKLGQMNQIDSQEFGKQLDVNNRNTQTLNNAKLTNLELGNKYDELDAMNRAKKSEALGQGITELGQLGSRNKLQTNELKARENELNAIAYGRGYRFNVDDEGTYNGEFKGGTGIGTPLLNNNPKGRIGVNKLFNIPEKDKNSKGNKGVKTSRTYKLKS